MSAALDGPSRCAVLLYTLGAERAGLVLGQLDPHQVQRIARAAQSLSEVRQESVESVLQEFERSMSGRRLLAGESGVFFRSVIEQTGLEDAQAEVSDNGLVPNADAANLTQLLQREHPQTAALVLANIAAERAADVLGRLEQTQRIDLIRRMASLSVIQEDVLRRIGDSLRTELGRRSSGPIRQVNGVELAAGILKRIGKDAAGQILESLAQDDGDLAGALKQEMFTFEELSQMDDRGVRNLLKEIDAQELAKALKVAGEEVKKKIFRNMSERAASMLAEDIEVLPPMRLTEVEEAQANIIAAASVLIQEGRAVVVGLGGDDVV
jgi:flagellar motor switch protein FliG